MTGTPPQMLPQQQMTPSQPMPYQPAPIQSSTGALPPTGLQQQMGALNNFYNQVQNYTVQDPNYVKGNALFTNSPGMGIGYDVRANQFQNAQSATLQQQGEMGATSLESIARNLATRYGLPIGRGRIVDDQGNFLYTPEQLADASGGQLTMGEAAAQMNYISQALANYKNEKQQKLGIAAMQTGLGQVQQRGRGSMASMQSGFYQGLADLYANQEYEAADFSYYIQKEQLEIQQELQRRYERQVKKQARGMFWSGVAITVVGLLSGNSGAAAQGAAGIAQSAGNTGYF